MMSKQAETETVRGLLYILTGSYPERDPILTLQAAQAYSRTGLRFGEATFRAECELGAAQGRLSYWVNGSALEVV